MAALDQRRGEDDGEEAAIAQQPARAMMRRWRGLDGAERLQPETHQRAERGHADDEPDQVSGRDDIEQLTAGQRGGDEGRRAPQPQRSVFETVLGDAAQRIGVDQGHHRRPQAAGRGIGDQDQERQMLRADDGKPDRGRKRRDHDGAAQRVTPLGKAGDEGQHGEARHRGNGGDDADPGRIDADRLQPHREVRQMGADQPEAGGIDQRQRASESPGGGSGGDL